MTKTVIIVNGKPRAGKDSSVLAMQQILEAQGVITDSFSSIDPIRDMLTVAGFRLHNKTPEDRALLAEVGDATEKHSCFRSDQCLKRIRKFFAITEECHAVMFLHVREPAMIARIRSQLWPSDKMLTVMVRSKREESATSNASDAGVYAMLYDAEIQNDGTLDDLAKACEQMLFHYGTISQLSLLH